MTNFSHCLSFGCHITVNDVAPGFCVRYVSGGEVSLLTLAHRCLCLFMDPSLMCVCFGAFMFVVCFSDIFSCPSLSVATWGYSSVFLSS